MRQSSIEWFQEQIIKIVNGTCELSEIEIFEKAKQMHEMEIMNAYLDGDSNGCGCYDYSTEEGAQEYYNSKKFITDGAEQD
jgi:hypothetical protein